VKVAFKGNIQAEEISEGEWKLIAPLGATVTNDDGSVVELEAPAGFETDFCSIPKPLEKIANRAGVIHDNLYSTATHPREWADEVLRAAVIACGYPAAIAEAFYIAVRFGGRSHYGWTPDVPDKRDMVYMVEAPVVCPPLVDLRPQCPPVYDQGQLGSCTANAIAAAIHFERMKQGLLPDFIPSRLFIYYNERAMENTVQSDSGAQIRDGIKSVAQFGDCPETAVDNFPGWNYTISDFAAKPPKVCYRLGLKYRAVQYARVGQNRDAIQQCLAQGYPIVFGFSVYQSFESADVAATGVAPMPGPDEQQLGGHAVLAVGYDDVTGRVLVRNSWGDGWGDKGYFTIPFDYLEDQNLAADFWTIRLVAA
jgi:hypothetical protein